MPLKDAWTKMVLTEPVDKVLFDHGLLMRTEKIMHDSVGIFSRIESCGFLYGILDQRTFYVFGEHQLGKGDSGTVAFRHLHPDIAAKYCDVASNIRSFRTMIYHAHPYVTDKIIRATQSQLEADRIIDWVKVDMKQGVYDHLRTHKKVVTINDCLTEALGMVLSPTDIDITPGKYHCLITPTPSDIHPTRHLNIFRVPEETLVKTGVYYGWDALSKVEISKHLFNAFTGRLFSDFS